ncbi:MAG: TonB-dependent receptor domain-containing protein, partial [Allosphingosinicella sp.]
SVRAGLGVLRTRITETQTASDPLLGKRFQRSPGLTAVATIDWRPFTHARLSAQLRSRGGYFSNDANTPALRIAGATVLDARAAYEFGSFTISAYVRNAFDKFYLTLLTAPTLGRAGDPRELGLGVEARF